MSNLPLDEEFLHFCQDLPVTLHDGADDGRVVHVYPRASENLHRVDVATEFEGFEVIIDGTLITCTEYTRIYSAGTVGRVFPGYNRKPGNREDSQ